MVKKVIAISVALSMGIVLSATPSFASTLKKSSTSTASSQTVTMAGPPTCCQFS